MPAGQRLLWLLICDSPSCTHVSRGLSAETREEAIENGRIFGWQIEGERTTCPACVTKARCEEYGRAHQPAAAKQ